MPQRAAGSSAVNGACACAPSGQQPVERRVDRVASEASATPARRARRRPRRGSGPRPRPRSSAPRPRSRTRTARRRPLELVQRGAPRRGRPRSGPRPRPSGRSPSRRSRSCDAVERAGPPRLGQPLQLELEVGHRLRVEQLAQLLGPEQLAQQLAVQRQRLGAALGQRRVALVHERADVVEQQRARERRGATASRR